MTWRFFQYCSVATCRLSFAAPFRTHFLLESIFRVVFQSSFKGLAMAAKRARVVLPLSQCSVLRATSSSVIRMVFTRLQISGMLVREQKASELILRANCAEIPDDSRIV